MLRRGEKIRSFSSKLGCVAFGKCGVVTIGIVEAFDHFESPLHRELKKL